MSEELSKADHEAAGRAIDSWRPDSRDGKAQAFYDGFKAGCLHARRTPGPATSEMLDLARAIVASAVTTARVKAACAAFLAEHEGQGAPR